MPVISSNALYKGYQHLTPIAVKSLAENKEIDTVVLVTAARALFNLKGHTDIEDLPDSKNFEPALEGLEETVRQLTMAKKKIVLVVDNPTLPEPRDCLSRKTSIRALNAFVGNNFNPKCELPLERHLELSKQYRDLLYTIEKRHPDSVKVFDTTRFMCDYEEGLCKPYKNGRFLYRYTDHMSDYAAGLIGTELNSFLQTD